MRVKGVKKTTKSIDIEAEVVKNHTAMTKRGIVDLFGTKSQRQLAKENGMSRKKLTMLPKAIEKEERAGWLEAEVESLWWERGQVYFSAKQKEQARVKAPEIRREMESKEYPYKLPTEREIRDCMAKIRGRCPDIDVKRARKRNFVRAEEGQCSAEDYQRIQCSQGYH